jgi:succinoglycan biosynthesis transport protein ExoP
MLTPETVRLDPAPQPAADNVRAPRLPAVSVAIPERPLPPALARPFTLRGLARALGRRWIVGLSVGLLLGAAAGYGAFVLQPTQQGSARARVQLPQAAEAACADGTIAARIKSRAFLDKIVSQSEIGGLGLLTGRPDPGEFLESELSVTCDPGPGVIAIQLSGDRLDEVAAVVNAVAQAAVRDVNSRDSQVRRDQLDRLQKAREQQDRALAPKRKQLEELVRRTGDDSGLRTVRLILVATALGDRQAELRRVQSDRRAAESQLKLASLSNDPPPKPAVDKTRFDDMMKSDPELKPLQAQIADLNGQIAQFTALYRDNPGRAKKAIEERGLQTKVDALYALAREQYERKLKALGTPVASERPRRERNSADELKARITACEAAEQSLAREIRARETELGRLQTDVAAIEELQRELGGSDAAGKELAASLDKARSQLAAPPPAVLLEDATAPAMGPDDRVPIAGLTGLGFFALGLVGVGVAEQRRRRLHNVADVAEGLELPVVGTQPPLSTACNPLDAGHASAADKTPWYQAPNDGVDCVRGLVMPAVPSAVARVVTVVSAIGGEGSSVLALQLAASLARAGRRTLLLDANLRRPALHLAFGFAQAPGLAEVLRNESTLPATMRPAPADRLWVLPAGTVDMRALQALARESTAALLERLKRDYEYIVIDGAAVLACADALLLAQRSDVILLSVLAGVSRLPTAHAAWRRLSLLGARPLGVVVQGAADDEAARLRYRLAQL